MIAKYLESLGIYNDWELEFMKGTFHKERLSPKQKPAAYRLRKRLDIHIKATGKTWDQFLSENK